MRTLVKNGTIVTAESEYKADILIVDEKITSIGTNLEGPSVSYTHLTLPTILRV